MTPNNTGNPAIHLADSESPDRGVAFGICLRNPVSRPRKEISSQAHQQPQTKSNAWIGGSKPIQHDGCKQAHEPSERQNKTRNSIGVTTGFSFGKSCCFWLALIEGKEHTVHLIGKC